MALQSLNFPVCTFHGDLFTGTACFWTLHDGHTYLYEAVPTPPNGYLAPGCRLFNRNTMQPIEQIDLPTFLYYKFENGKYID